ncbi:MAG: fused MFS/spermidine synthase [Burkholderiales bacterium]|nr:fused MFS/spermidine synthase [Burkholderiales bacterium]
MASSIEVSEEEGVRYLHFGSRWIQGAMRVARPFGLELEYTQHMMFPLLLQPDTWPRRVLVIGLGAASFTRFLHRHRPRAAQTVVEITPAVIDVARQHFRLPPEGPRLTITIGDGHDYLTACERDFDLILVDGFDARGRSGTLDTLPFYCQAQARLGAGGLLAANLLTRNHGHRGSLDRLRAAFDGRAAALPRCASGNVVLVAAVGPHIGIEARDLMARARACKRATGLDLVPVARAVTGQEASFHL